MSTELNSVNAKQEIEVDAEKRAFMKKFGKYAAVGAGMSVLMSPAYAQPVGSCGNNGVGTECKPHPVTGQ